MNQLNIHDTPEIHVIYTSINNTRNPEALFYVADIITRGLSSGVSYNRDWIDDKILKASPILGLRHYDIPYLIEGLLYTETTWGPGTWAQLRTSENKVWPGMDEIVRKVEADRMIPEDSLTVYLGLIPRFSDIDKPQEYIDHDVATLEGRLELIDRI